MPTLQFKGRNIIWNHHLTVPYHTLDEVPALSFDPAKGEGNIIVEGDNLTALKALLPQYAGKINCIFIDPPYNTGNDVAEGIGWTYSDNVNSPVIQQWLNKEVGVDDLTKHDKWLCMITPRLKLLRDLLDDKGAIFIAIDDNEYANLKNIMNDIFGEENFVANIVWQARKSVQNDTDISVNHNYVLVFAKNRRQKDRRLKEANAEKWYKDEGFVLRPLTLDKNKFSNPDNDPRGMWKADPFDAPNVRENLTYAIVNPNTGKEYFPPKGRHWRTEEINYEKLLKEDRILFGKTGRSGPQLKVFWDDKKEYGEVDTSWWGEGSFDSYIDEDIDFETISEWTNYGTTTSGSQLLQKIFDGEKVFNNPKPLELLMHIIRQAANKDALILDSFAGSGTTGQAVLELNKEDGGNRKFILVQMTEATEAEPDKNIARDITAERIKRAIKKYDLNSGFTYYKLGTAIDAETLLQGDLPTYEQFAKYVYYLCTGQHHSKPKEIKPKDFFVGNASNTAIYLIYEQDFDKLTQLALNLSLAEKFRKASANKPIVVYAPACFLDEEYLQDFNMQFVSIPYNLFQKNEQP